jgi:phosphoribosylpyrophosphate synthetase
MLPILVQQVYVLSRQGRNEEATKFCENIQIDKSVEKYHRFESGENLITIAAFLTSQQGILLMSTLSPPRNKQILFLRIVSSIQHQKYPKMTSLSNINRQFYARMRTH